MSHLPSRFPAVAVLAAMMAGPYVASACEVKLEQIEPATLSRADGYDVFDAIGHAEQFSFELINLRNDGEACEVDASVEPLSGKSRLSSLGKGTLDYEIRASADLANRSEGISFRLTLEPGERRRLDYFVYLPPSQFVANGNFEDRLAIDVSKVVDGLLETEDRRETLVRAVVNPSARIRFVGAVGHRQSVDFGELVKGKSSPPIFLDVRSTSNYEIRVSSEEGGRLVQRVGGEIWSIDYTALLANTRLSLSPFNQNSQRFSGPTDQAGDRHPIRFELGDIGNRRAGTYRDHMIIEITPIVR